MNTLDFIEEIKRRHGVKSDYAVKKLLGVTSSCMSSYRGGHSQFDDYICLRVAELLDLEPMYVIACIHAERARRPEVASTWRKMADRLKGTAAGVLVLGIMGLGQAPVDHQPACQADSNVHSAKWRRWIRALLGLLALSAALFCPPAEAGPWSTGDTARELTYQAVDLVDWAQTRTIAAHPDRWKEDNPFLGRHPTAGQVNRWFVGLAVIHAAVSYALPAGRARQAWQYITIGYEGATVARNLHVGININF